MNRTKGLVAFVAGAVMGAGAVGMLMAQPSGFERRMLLTAPIAASGQYQASIGTATVPVGSSTPRHLHPGDEIGVVIDGEGLIEIDGSAPVRVLPGQAFHIPSGKPHLARSVGKVPAKVVSIWIVEKGKPLATNAP